MSTVENASTALFQGYRGAEDEGRGVGDRRAEPHHALVGRGRVDPDPRGY